MTKNHISPKYSIFVDESGLPQSNDPNQHWFVLGGVGIHTDKIDDAQKYIYDVCHSYIKDVYFKNPRFELKGRWIVNPKSQRRPFGLRLEDRVKFARELLCVELYYPGTQLFVFGADSKCFPIREDLSRFVWSNFIPEVTQNNCDLFALAELIGDFAFFLDKDLSSSIEEVISNLPQERNIDTGKIFVDEATGLKKRLITLEKCLRMKNIPVHLDIIYPKDYKYSLLGDNVYSPIEMEVSHKNELIQVADILAALVRYKQEFYRLPESLEQLYYETRISFQSHYRIYPEESLPDPIVRPMSNERWELLKKAGMVNQ